MSTSPNLWLQQLPFLAPLFQAATWLGNEEFFLLLLPFVYLCIDRKSGLRLGALILSCDALCGILKIASALPRPYWVDARVHAWAQDASFGFPSSHAQVGTAVWLFIAQRVKKSWMWIVAIVLIALISLSRVFLGVHYLFDVAGGALIGLAFWVAFLQVEPKITTWFARQNLVMQIGFSALAALSMLLLFGLIRVLVAPDTTVSYAKYLDEARSWDAIVARAGAIFGLGCGAALALRWARFQTAGSIAQKAARFVVALIGVVVCYIGLKTLFPSQPESAALVFRFVRYALLTLWITFGAPLVLLKMRLMQPLVNLEVATSPGF